MSPTHQEPLGPSKIAAVLWLVGHSCSGQGRAPKVAWGCSLAHREPQSPAYSPAEKDLGVGLTGCWDAELKPQNSLWSEGLSVENEQEPVLNGTLPN